MKKRLFLYLSSFLIITGCINKPEPVDIDATIQAAVESAIAPYADVMENAVRKDALEQSQQAQSAQIGAEMDAKINILRTELATSPLSALPTNVIATRTPSANDCINKFNYLSDITIPDGVKTMPLTKFKKSWYIENSGSCTWDSTYRVTYNTGAEVGVAKKFPILKQGSIAKPGETLIISAEIQAPEELGKYITYWAIESGDGKVFGAGERQNIFLSSEFIVAREYSFYENFSSAVCSDDAGVFYCGSSDTSSDRGAAWTDAAPVVESNYKGSPAILIAPPHTEGGKTRVAIGPIRVPIGTWFRASVSCRSNAPLCNVFVRAYVKNNDLPEQIIADTNEWNDGYASEWNTQMSKAGGYHDQDLTYIFEVEANGMGDSDDVIIIQMPRLTEYPPQQ